MNLWEFLTVALVAFMLPLGIIKLILDYRRTKLEARKGPSLTARELHQLVRQAVEEAQAPLMLRLEQLEKQLRALPEATSSSETSAPTPTSE